MAAAVASAGRRSKAELKAAAAAGGTGSKGQSAAFSSASGTWQRCCRAVWLHYRWLWPLASASYRLSPGAAVATSDQPRHLAWLLFNQIFVLPCLPSARSQAPLSACWASLKPRRASLPP